MAEKIRWKSVVLGAVAYLIIAQVIHILSSILTMGYYTDPNYFGVWSNIMMPGPGGPPAEFYILSITLGLVTALVYSWMFSKVKGLIKGDYLRKGARYGLALFLVAGLPFFFTNLVLVNLPIGLLLVWLSVDGFLVYLLGGIAISRLGK